jgi:8-oxo-dGTP pyrophosphatase MutT (NUDIX family)
MNNNWIKLSEKKAYENPWISVSEHQVINPSGNNGIYGVVHFKNLAIGIVPIDQEGYIYMVGQFRYVLGKYSLEIPEGGGPIDDDPLESAKRELKEETGLEAANWEKLLEMETSNSVTDERAIVYLATGLVQGDASPEETEELIVSKIHLNEAYQMVLDGEITDSISVAAILKMKIKSLENEK